MKRNLSIILAFTMLLSTCLQFAMTETVYATDEPIAIMVELNSFDDIVGGDSDSTLLWKRGDASVESGAMRIVPASEGKAGTVVRRNQIRLTDGFSTYFQFQIHNLEGTYADGLSFIVYDADEPQVGSSGEGLGYKNIDDSIAVEFDIYYNEGVQDPDSNHAAIMLNGNNVHNSQPEDSSISYSGLQGSAINAWVDYNDGIVTTTFGTGSTKADTVNNKTISRNVGTFLEGKDVFVGFSASTGGSWANHDLLKWYFKDSYVADSLEPDGAYSQAASTVGITLDNDINTSYATVIVYDAAGTEMENQDVELFLDDESQGVFNSGTDGYTYNLIGLADGTHTVRAVAVGGASNFKGFAISASTNAGNNSVSSSESSVTEGGAVTLTAVGDRQSEAGVVNGDERYVPISWTSTETDKSGTFNLNEGSYTSTYTTSAAGSYIITATFRKQTWDGSDWVDVPGEIDTKETSLTVNVLGDFNLTAESGNSHTELSWDAVEGTTAYEIFTDDSFTATVIGSVYTYDVEGLTNGTTYNFEVNALDHNEVIIATSNEVSATPKTVPGAPTDVTAIAWSRQALVSFSTPADNGGSAITSYTVTSNPDNKTATGTSGPITVIGLTNRTTYTFTVTATNAVGESAPSAASSAVTPHSSSVSSESSTTEQPTTKSETTNTGVDILVNGKTENAGTATITTEQNQTVTTIAVDEKKLEQKLEAEGNSAIVTIPVNTKIDILIGELNGQIVKNMENKQAVLEVKTENVTYTLPAQQININAISEQIGSSVELKDIKVQVEIAKAAHEDVELVENSAKQGEFSIIAPPVEFTVKCTYGGKTIETSSFNAYVERTIAIPDGIDPNKITTGVIVDPDGTTRHVPTRVTVINGKYYAVINSLTNSLYSVVWHPLEFKDVANHWAKEPINDMGSRMVISGVGNGMFEPSRDITRAEFAAIIVRALGLKPGVGDNKFTDVNSSNWYCDYIKTAAEYKIISGYGGGKFGPKDKITREQAMTMIARAMDITGLKVQLADEEMDKILTSFGDAAKSSDYARGSIAACVKTGIVSGRNGKLIAPRENITRAEVAVIIRGLLLKSDLI